MSNAPQRQAWVRFDVTDNDGVVQGQITPAEPGTLTWKDGARSIRGLRLFPADALALDPYTRRLAPVWVEDCAETVLGQFVCQSGSDVWTKYLDPADGCTAEGYVAQWDISDLTARLDIPLTRPYGIPVGGTATPFIETLLEACAFTVYDLGWFPAPLSEPAVFDQGRDTYLSAIESVLADVGGRFYIAADGTPTAEATPAAADITAARTYTTSAATSNVLGRPVYGNQPFSPNRWEAVGGTDDAPIVGVYTLPSTAPNWTGARGFTVLDRFDVNATTQTAADQAAAGRAVDSIAKSLTAEFTSAVDPAAGAWDAVTIDGALYVVQSWSYPLVGSAAMRTTAGKVWQG